MRWAGHVARMGEERGVYKFLVGKPEGICINMPEDGLSTRRNMLHKCKNNQMN